jgi:hypothetical protein
VNLYGFAAGDPVNNSDPFGTEVRFADDAARDAYRSLKLLATMSSGSSDASKSSGGTQLLRMLEELEKSERIVSVGFMQANWAARVSAQDVATVRANDDASIVIDPASASRRTGSNVHTLLAHELGHAFTSVVDREINPARSAATSIRMEDAARSAQGCKRRLLHDSMFSPSGCR